MQNQKSSPLITIAVAYSVKPEIEEVELAGETLDSVRAVVMVSAAAIRSSIVAQLVELPGIAA